MTFQSASSAVHASGTVTCDFGEVARDDQAIATITVATPASPGTELENTASVDGDEPDPDTENNTATIVTELFTPPTSA